MHFPTRALAVAALVLAVTLPGCLTPAQPAEPHAPAPTIHIVSDRPDTTFGAITTGPAAGADVNATTANAPKLVEGEWWRIQFEGGMFEDIKLPELVRVVGSAGPDGYVVGMPHEGWFKEAIIMHAPAFGDVHLDLSYDVHNMKFEPLHFPLTKGKTWQTPFGGSNYTATVESSDDSTAAIRFDPPASNPQPTDPAYGAIQRLSPIDTTGSMHMVYDARQHEIVQFDASFGSWKVVAHGYDFTGWVTVPRAEHTAIDYGQFLPATPGGPPVTRTVNIDGGYNRLTLVHAIVAFAPGAYRIREVAPNGTEYLTESVASKGLTVKFYEASKPDGAWKLEDIVGGGGATYTMGMAYHQYDIRLPDGAIRADHSHPVIR